MRAIVGLLGARILFFACEEMYRIMSDTKDETEAPITPVSPFGSCSIIVHTAYNKMPWLRPGPKLGCENTAAFFLFLHQ
jgi:hypothetical protein